MYTLGEPLGTNPEIVVSVLIEQGEHGYLAARVAAQVVKAYAAKQRRKNNTRLAQSASLQPVEMGGVWGARTAGSETPALGAGRFDVKLDPKPVKKRAQFLPELPAAAAVVIPPEGGSR